MSPLFKKKIILASKRKIIRVFCSRFPSFIYKKLSASFFATQSFRIIMGIISLHRNFQINQLFYRKAFKFHTSQKRILLLKKIMIYKQFFIHFWKTFHTIGLKYVHQPICRTQLWFLFFPQQDILRS